MDFNLILRCISLTLSALALSLCIYNGFTLFHTLKKRDEEIKLLEDYAAWVTARLADEYRVNGYPADFPLDIPAGCFKRPAPTEEE